MLERCHVSTRLHNVAFVDKQGLLSCDLASCPSSNRAFPPRGDEMLSEGWVAYLLLKEFYIFAAAAFLQGGRMLWNGHNLVVMGHILYIYSP